MKVALDFYDRCFADPSAFTVLLVGAVEPLKVKTLVERYLANIPTRGKYALRAERRTKHTRGVVTKRVQAGHEKQAGVRIVFHGPETWSASLESDFAALAAVLESRLETALVDKGDVYRVSVNAYTSREVGYDITVDFGCAPGRGEALSKVVLDELRAIGMDGGAGSLPRLRQNRRNAIIDFEKNVRRWSSRLKAVYRYGDDPRSLADIESQLAGFSKDRVRAVARKVLSGARVEGFLEPALTQPQ